MKINKNPQRQASPARLAIEGVTKSGKTFCALMFAHEMGERILVIEANEGNLAFGGKVTKYLGDAPHGVVWNFDVITMGVTEDGVADPRGFHPATLIEALRWVEANSDQYDVLIIDSLSAFWEGRGGMLELAEREGGFPQGWRAVSRYETQILDLMGRLPIHLIVTLRQKIEHAMVTGDSGRNRVERLGLGVIGRKTWAYYFEAEVLLDEQHNAELRAAMGSATETLNGASAHLPGPDFILPYLNFLKNGAQPTGEQLLNRARARFVSRVLIDPRLKGRFRSPREVAEWFKNAQMSYERGHDDEYVDAMLADEERLADLLESQQ